MRSEGQDRPTFREAAAVWAKIGLINFGGPAGQIALMHRILVEERRWIDEPRFLHELNYCMLLPGPEAQQLATYVGWLLHGVRGGVVAGTLFVLPGLAVLLGLSIAYWEFGHLAVVQGLFFGLKAAVLAVVAEALLRVARRALRSRTMVIVAIAAFVAIAFVKAPFPLIVAGAALVGMALPPGRIPAIEATDRATPEGGGLAASVRALLIWGAVWLGPLAILAAILRRDHVYTQVGLFFSKVALVTFGGAYAVLAYVAQQAVETHHWLRPDEMLTGLGLAETTPGPLILVLVFVGFLAGARGATGLEPLIAGAFGALVTAWMIFAPSFLFIFAGAPFVERLRDNRRLAAALAAVTAAVVGVIANLALWFGLHVLFGKVGAAKYGFLSIPIPAPGSFDPLAAIIALSAAAALIGLRANLLLVLAVAAAAGLAAASLF